MKKEIKCKVDHVDMESTYVGNVKLPPPPKPGEYMYCQICGEPILPEQISKLPNVRKRELSWHIHNSCYMCIDQKLDAKTPGVVNDRYAKEDTLHNLIRHHMKENKCTK